MKIFKKNIFILVLSLVGVMVFACAGAQAQSLAGVGEGVAGNTDGQRGEDDVSFIIESLDQQPEINPAVGAMVDKSKIPAVDTEEASKYTLGATDVIQVSVMRHPEVTGEFMINQEGKIQYEFVGDIKIAGLTKDEVSKLIKEKLTEYIISPEVSVKIIGYNSKIVYVVGEVYRPGKIFMRGDTITIREALMQAGLPMLSGVTKKSKLITPAKDGNAEKKDINVYALLYQGDLRENDTMYPGDVLYIPPTFLTKTMRAIAPIAAPIGTAAGTGRTLTTGF